LQLQDGRQWKATDLGRLISGIVSAAKELSSLQLVVDGDVHWDAEPICHRSLQQIAHFSMLRTLQCRNIDLTFSLARALGQLSHLTELAWDMTSESRIGDSQRFDVLLDRLQPPQLASLRVGIRCFAANCKFVAALKQHRETLSRLALDPWSACTNGLIGALPMFPLLTELTMGSKLGFLVDLCFGPPSAFIHEWPGQLRALGLEVHDSRHLAALRHFTGLTRLTACAMCWHSQEGWGAAFAALESLTALQKLSLEGRGSFSQHGAALANLSNLTGLSIDGFFMTFEDLVALSMLPKLVDLQLGRIIRGRSLEAYVIFGRCAAVPRVLGQLHTLKLGEWDLQALNDWPRHSAAPLLGFLPASLTCLDVQGCHLRDAGLRWLLSGLTGLEDLNVSFNELSPAGWGCLGVHTGLTRLSGSGWLVFSAASCLPRLRELAVHSLGFAEGSRVASVLRALPPTVERVTIDGRPAAEQFGKDELRAVRQALPRLGNRPLAGFLQHP
jgi:hypothetical protein